MIKAPSQRAFLLLLSALPPQTSVQAGSHLIGIPISFSGSQFWKRGRIQAASAMTFDWLLLSCVLPLEQSLPPG